jgi:hypothetical protein
MKRNQDTPPSWAVIGELASLALGAGALASDYTPAAMLRSALAIRDRGLLDLLEAINLVTAIKEGCFVYWVGDPILVAQQVVA